MPDAPILGAHPPGARPPASDKAATGSAPRAAKKVKLDDAAFGARFVGPLVHQSVRAEQAARRRGTAATKTRAMVSGGGAKPWRQKGTGRARAGSSRSPIWTGGGVAFGPQPRSYTFKVNRKEQRAALRSALSLHAERKTMAILDAGAFQEPRTRRAQDLLDDWDQIRPTLVVLAAEESSAALSFRNLARVAVLSAENVGVTDLLGAASLVVSEPALAELTARAGDRSKVDRQTGRRSAEEAKA
jgi:large subunit ribosomal protein L4